MKFIKRYEITDTFTGQSFGYLQRISTRKLARKMAQQRANEIGYKISLHEVGKYGWRTLLDTYEPKQ